MRKMRHLASELVGDNSQTIRPRPLKIAYRAIAVPAAAEAAATVIPLAFKASMPNSAMQQITMSPAIAENRKVTHVHVELRGFQHLPIPKLVIPRAELPGFDPEPEGNRLGRRPSFRDITFRRVDQ